MAGFRPTPVVLRRSASLPYRRARLRGRTQEWAGGVVLRPLGADLVGLRALLCTGEVGGAVRTRPRYRGGVEEEARMAAAVGGVARHQGSYISRSWLQKEAVEADDRESSAGSSSASEMSARHGPRYMASAPGAAGAARIAPGLVTTRPLEAAFSDSPSARLHHCAAHLPAHAHLRLLTCRLASLPTPWPSCHPPASSPRWRGHHGTRWGGATRPAPRLSRAGRSLLREASLLPDTGSDGTAAGRPQLNDRSSFTAPQNTSNLSISTTLGSAPFLPCWGGGGPGHTQKHIKHKCPAGSLMHSTDLFDK